MAAYEEARDRAGALEEGQARLLSREDGLRRFGGCWRRLLARPLGAAATGMIAGWLGPALAGSCGVPASW